MYTEEFVKKYTEKLQRRLPEANKSDYGKLLIIGGSFGMSGAPFLSGYAAFRSGIGMVRFFGPECNRIILQTLLPEAMYTSGIRSMMSAEEEVPDREVFERALSWADYLVIGPGLSTERQAVETVKLLFQTDLSEKKLVLFDADALNIVSGNGFSLGELSLRRKSRGAPTNVVVTPHIGEACRLTGKSAVEIKAFPEETALAFSGENYCVTVLKDAVSFVSTPEGQVYQNNSGHASMAKAGSGDVLTGVIAAATAVIGDGVTAGAAAGCWLHGKAGERAAEKYGEHGVLARNLAEEIPYCI